MSQIHNQLVASHEEIDMEAAQKRLAAMDIPKAGPTLTPKPQTQPQAPAPRKKRSDAGIPKKPPADPDEIVLRLTLAEARNAAISCGKFDCYGISEHIQDQIIAQLQKRLDALQKQK